MPIPPSSRPFSWFVEYITKLIQFNYININVQYSKECRDRHGKEK